MLHYATMREADRVARVTAGFESKLTKYLDWAVKP